MDLTVSARPWAPVKSIGGTPRECCVSVTNYGIVCRRYAGRLRKLFVLCGTLLSGARTEVCELRIVRPLCS